jgi:AcrR family transcriptional regulator
MPIIVDKDKKRRDIACACKGILLKYGIKNLTISQIATAANIGKGTVYEYFANKEEIVFEIMTTFIAEHEKKLSEIITEDITTKEKLFHFLYLGFEDEHSRQQLALYREFIAISMTSGTDEMIDFNIQCREKFAGILGQILKDGIRKGELPPEIEGLVSAILLFGLGLITEVHTAVLDPKDEITSFLEGLFKLIEMKEKR